MLNFVHTIFSAAALISGAMVLSSRKATRRHRKVGYVYVVSMLGSLLTSFFIFDLFGTWGAYHWLAIVSLVTLCLGMYFPLFARNFKGWAVQHYMWMSYSYVGLVMAGGSHLFQYTTHWPSWLSISLYWALPYVVGTFLIFRNRKKILADVKDRFGYDFTVR